MHVAPLILSFLLERLVTLNITHVGSFRISDFVFFFVCLCVFVVNNKDTQTHKNEYKGKDNNGYSKRHVVFVIFR